MAREIQRERTLLYLITPPQIADIAAFVQQFKAAIEGGDIASLQVRIKTDDEIDSHATREVAQAVQPLCREHDIALIINDSPQLCRALQADGVHLGAADIDIKAARELVGPDVIIGATCKASRHTAMMAGEAGADYVAFGAFHPTETKADTSQAEPDILTWCQMFLTLPLRGNRRHIAGQCCAANPRRRRLYRRLQPCLEPCRWPRCCGCDVQPHH